MTVQIGFDSSTVRTPKSGVIGFASVFIIVQLLYHSVNGVPLNAEYAILTITGGLFAAWLIVVLFRNLPLKTVPRLVIVWFALFIVQMFADFIEGVFFTTSVSTLSDFLSGTLMSAGITFIESVVGSLLFPTSLTPISLRSSLVSYVRGRSWVLRFVLGSVTYLPVYFLFGALISPLTNSYYTNSSVGLVIPDFSVIIPVELLRGFLFALALVPIISALRLSRRSTFFLVALSLYVIGAYVPFVAGTTLPPALRFYHSIEIFADSVVFGAFLTYLFRSPRDSFSPASK